MNSVYSTTVAKALAYGGHCHPVAHLSRGDPIGLQLDGDNAVTNLGEVSGKTALAVNRFATISSGGGGLVIVNRVLISSVHGPLRDETSATVVSAVVSFYLTNDGLIDVRSRRVSVMNARSIIWAPSPVTFG
jgi:hypothetical protein